MKSTPLLTLLSLLLTSTCIIGQVDPQELRSSADTCSDNFQLTRWAATLSRSNAIGNPQLSHMVLSIAESRIDPLEDSATYSNLIHEHAILHSIRQEGDSAVVYINRALEWIPQEDSVRIGYLYRNLGVAQDMNADFEEAIESEYMALRYLPEEDSLFRPLTYLEMAKMLYRVGSYSLGATYASRSIEYFEATGRLYDLGSAYNALGLCLMNTDTITRASIEALHKSQWISLMSGDTVSAAQRYVNLGIAHSQIGDMDSALYYLELANNYPGFNQVYSETVKVTVWANLGAILYDIGQNERAKGFSLKAYSFAENGGHDFILERITSNLYKIALVEGDTTRAFRFLQEYTAIFKKNNALTNKSRLQSLEKDVTEQIRMREYDLLQREIEVSREKYQSEKRLLYTGIGFLIVMILLLLQLYTLVLRKRREAAINYERLNRLDMAKNRLFSIIGHDLRGPIGNSLYLLKELPQPGDKMSSDSESILENVQQGLTEVHGLLENLLIWSRDQAKDLEMRKTDVKVSRITEQCQQIVSILLPMRNMNIQFDVPHDLVWRLDPNAYSTIIRNLVSNALKYAPEGTTVSCSAYEENGLLITRICDEGSGVPDSVIRNVESRSGHNGSGRGMGLYLVYMLTKEHGGTMEFVRKEGESCVVCSIPKV